MFDPKILEFLQRANTESFAGTVFRATRKNLEPLASSTSGGRWMQPERNAILYTSRERHGAIAEITFHWGQSSPPISSTAMVYSIKVEIDRVIRITRDDFESLGIDPARYSEINYARTQEIGAAAAFLGIQALLVPCARADAENLVIISSEHGIDSKAEVTLTEEVKLDFDKEA